MATTKDISNSNTIDKSTSRTINNKLDLLDKKIDSFYNDIYLSRTDNRDNLDKIMDNLDNAIDNLQGSDTTVSNMSELLRRIDSTNNSNAEDVINSVQSMFNDGNILGSYIMNNNIHDYIAGQNYNYDLICKYLPRLQDALEIKRDHVLSSDNFSKDFLNPVSDKSSKDRAVKFAIDTDRIEKEYDMSEFLDDTYMNTSKYGEDFIYIVPYDVAFKRLINRSANRLNNYTVGQNSIFESYTGGKDQILKESFNTSSDFISYCDEDNSKDIPNLGSVTLYYNKSNVIQSAIKEYAVIKEKSELAELQSMSAIYEAGENTSNKLDTMFSGLRSVANKMKKNSIPSDGLILNNNIDTDKLDKNFLGAVLERLPRENIIPVYIGKKCLGYYYFEFAEDPTACGFCGGHHTTPMLGNANRMQYDLSERQQELAIGYIASRISSAIDTKFINANKDLKEEIYSILSYNEKFNASRANNIGITFIPAEDIVHTYFKLDEYTHRGISDLERAVTPAMLYILLYLTDIIAKITRSTDKRVYYVKQNVETNVARTMMNVVQQIKKGNLGMRQIESMNNILNIVGKYNDLIIPMGPSGDPPVSFEIMQGQDIQTPSELMEKMEESAINTIMPFDLVNATYQQDFATRFTLSNTRFLNSITTRQRKTEKMFSKIYTKVYKYETGDINIGEIEIILPPPVYLNITNNSQLIDSINQMADKIIESEMESESDDIKAEWKRLYLRDNLSTYLNYDRLERLLSLAKVNVSANKQPAAADGEMADVMDDEY